MEFVGILLRKLDEREGDSRNGHWKVAQYLLETIGIYPKKMTVEVRDGVMGRVAKFDALISKTVRMEFEAEASEYQGRWYNHFYAYNIVDYAEEKAKEAEAAEAANKPAKPVDNVNVNDNVNGGGNNQGGNPAPPNNDGDDLPF